MCTTEPLLGQTHLPSWLLSCFHIFGILLYFVFFPLCFSPRAGEFEGSFGLQRSCLMPRGWEWHKRCVPEPSAWSQGMACSCNVLCKRRGKMRLFLGKTKWIQLCRGRAKCGAGEMPRRRSQPGNCLCDGEGWWVMGHPQLCRGPALSWGGRDPGDTCREEPNGLERLPVLLLVLFLSAEIPPARQKGPETVAKSSGRTRPCRTSPRRVSHMGWHVPWVLCARSIWDGVLGSINQSPTERTQSSGDLGANPSISIPIS